MKPDAFDNFDRFSAGNSCYVSKKAMTKACVMDKATATYLMLT